MKTMNQFAVLLALLLGAAAPSFSQANPNPQAYFKDYIGLSDDQIAAIRGGQAFAKTLHSRTSDEIFAFGAVYIDAEPESYITFSRDFDRLRRIPGHLAIGEFSNPPQLSDLKDFTFNREDVEALKNCNLVIARYKCRRAPSIRGLVRPRRRRKSGSDPPEARTRTARRLPENGKSGAGGI
jgi:hypothetical protein